MSEQIIQAGPFTLRLHERTHVMGILNVTPDSFSDGGRFNRLSAAIDHAASLIQDGADMIDIGGESTRPGSKPVAETEELERVIPVVEALASRFSVPLSIDTYKAEVARQAIEAGAHIINDVWRATADPLMARVAACTNAPIILMHNRRHSNYDDLIGDILQDLQESIDLVMKAGVEKQQIILDPGIGFAKTHEQNIYVMRHLHHIVDYGYPVLLGTSRKRFIGHILDAPVHDRVEGTMATVSLGVHHGCHIVRVHDVKAAVRTVKMMDAMLGKKGLATHG